MTPTPKVLARPKRPRPRGAPSTSQCVRCLKAARFHCGHVLRGRTEVIAGWCSERCFKRAGFRGHWTAEMNPKAQP